MTINKKLIFSEVSSKGSIFKVHRKDRKMTLYYVAAQTGVSSKKLSDFEKGRTNLKDETIKLLYKCLEIDYVYNEENKIKFKRCFYNFYEALLCFDENIENEYRIAREMLKFIQTTNVYPQYLLMELIYHVFHNDMLYDYEKNITIIQAHIQNLDNKQKLIFHDCVALYFMGQKLYHEALKHFEYALEYSHDGAGAIVNYHKGLLYMEMNDPCKALGCVLKAKFYFDNNHYVKRSILSDLKIACIYRYLHCYDKALEIYAYCIPLMKSYSMESKYKTAYINYLWCMILAEKYNDVITVIDELDDELKQSSIFYLYYSLANEKLGHHKSAAKNIIEAKKCLKGCEQTPLLKVIVETYYTYLSTNKKQETKLKKLNLTLNEAQNSNNIELQRFVIEMIIDILDPELQADAIIDYYKMMLKSYKS